MASANGTRRLAAVSVSRPDSRMADALARGAHRQLFPEDQGDRRAVRRSPGDLCGVHAPAGDLRAAPRGRVSRRAWPPRAAPVSRSSSTIPRAPGSAPASRSSTSPARSFIWSISKPCCCKSSGRPASPPTTPMRCAPTCPKVAFLAMDARHCAGAEMAEMMAYAASVGSAHAQREAGAVGFVGCAADATAHFFGQRRRASARCRTR